MNQYSDSEYRVMFHAISRSLTKSRQDKKAIVNHGLFCFIWSHIVSLERVIRVYIDVYILAFMTHSLCTQQ